MQSTVSVLMAAIVFIVEFFSGILSSASDREPAKPDKPDKPAVSSTLTVFSRNDEFSDLVGKYQPQSACRGKLQERSQREARTAPRRSSSRFQC